MEKIIQVSEKKIEELTDTVDRLREQLNPAALHSLKNLEEALGKIELTPLSLLQKQLETFVRDTAALVGKQVQCEFAGFHLEVRPSLRDSLFTACTHAARNAIDHGIETSAKRIARGKNAIGKIQFIAKLHDGSLEIKIQDDGQGVEYSKIAQRAIAAGLRSPGQIQQMIPREILALLFMPGFSTSTEATLTSGRGMGLDVVKTVVEEQAGKVILQEVLPFGFELILEVPLDRIGLEAVSMQIGTETIWMQQKDFEILEESSTQDLIRLPFAEALQWKAPKSDSLGLKGRCLIKFSTQIPTPEILEVDSIGIAQFKIFRPLDPLWKTIGPPWLKRWMQEAQGLPLACRMSSPYSTFGLSLLADPEVVFRILNHLE